MVQQAPEKRQASRAHVPSLSSHSQSVVYLEGQTCPPPSIVAFANALSARAMPSSRRLGEAISVEADSSSFCIWAIPALLTLHFFSFSTFIRPQ